MLEAVHSSQPIMLRLLLLAQREVEMPGQVLVTDPRGLVNTQAGDSRDSCLDRCLPLLPAHHPASQRTLRSDRLDGISATTSWIIFGNAAVWAIWSVLSGEYAAGVPALVNGPAALLILRRLHRSKRPDARVTHLSVPPCEPGLPLRPPGLTVSACPYQPPGDQEPRVTTPSPRSSAGARDTSLSLQKLQSAI